MHSVVVLCKLAVCIDSIYANLIASDSQRIPTPVRIKKDNLLRSEI